MVSTRSPHKFVECIDSLVVGSAELIHRDRLARWRRTLGGQSLNAARSQCGRGGPRDGSPTHCNDRSSILWSRNGGLWDETDGFFYDVLRRPDGSSIPLKVRSAVGLIPVAAVTVLNSQLRAEFPGVAEETVRFFEHHPAVLAAMPLHGRQLTQTGPTLVALFVGRLQRYAHGACCPG